ncbi:MAG: ATP-binding cassette domain-containing protein [Candidatus Bathyarchaeia archaeon]
MDAVRTVELSKSFGDFHAVDHVNLQIGSEVFGLLGPNGAGKTTLTRMLTTVLTPTEGTAVVAGADIRTEADKVRRRIGVVAQATTLDFELSAYENMDIYGEYFDIPRQLRKERIKRLLEVVGLADRAKSLVGGFSGGMKRRLEIVRSLIHEPEILFLDEPTTGLDPQARAAVWEYLVKLHKDQGITLVITTHFMDEAEGLCDRLAIVDYGKIVALGTPHELKRQVSKGDIVEADFSSAPETALNALKSADFVLEIKRQDSLLTIRVNNGAEAIPKIIEIVDANGGKVRTITLREITLDDVFLSFTGRSLRE